VKGAPTINVECAGEYRLWNGAERTQLNATASVPGTFVYTPSAGAVLNAGTGQTLSVTFTPTDTANYTPATASVAITVHEGNADDLVGHELFIVYGSALSATQPECDASVAGTFVYTPAAGTVLSAGSARRMS